MGNIRIMACTLMTNSRGNQVDFKRASWHHHYRSASRPRLAAFLQARAPENTFGRPLAFVAAASGGRLALRAEVLGWTNGAASGCVHLPLMKSKLADCRS
jgi:hypothetical protein